MPRLYPSNLSAYDLEEGLPVSCVQDGLKDKSGRLWVNVCFDQPELRTINFFRFDGQHSELIYWESLPPGTEQCQATLATIAETGELYGFFRPGNHFFRFNPDTRQTRFYQLTDTTVDITWMQFSADHGLIIMAQNPDVQQLYRLQGDTPEMLLNHSIKTAPGGEVQEFPGRSIFRVLAGDDLWFYEKPSVYYLPDKVQEQFRLLRFNFRNRSLKTYSYNDLFSGAPPPSAAAYRQFVLCADRHNQVMLLDGNCLYALDRKTCKAALKAVFDNHMTWEKDPGFFYNRATKDAVGNLLFLLWDEKEYYKGVLLDTSGRFLDYSAVLQQTARMTRYGTIFFNGVWSRDYQRNILTFSPGGMLSADIQFNGSISYRMKGIPTRAISEWRPGQYLVRAETRSNFLLVRPLEGPAVQLFYPELKAEQPFHPVTLSNLIKTTDGYWWYGSDKSLVRFDSNKVRTIFPVGFEFVKFTFLDARHVALVNSKRGDLMIYNVSTKTGRPWLENGKPLSIPGDINELFLSKDSTLWIASLQGLWQVGLKTGKSQKIGYPEGFRDERIMCLSEDAAGRLWVGTYGSGLHLYNPYTGALEVVNQEKGLSNNTVVGILEDAQGYRWLSTYRGINLLSSQGQVLAQLFEQDGLSTNEFNRYSYFKDSNGRLIFGSIHGINIIEPDLLRKQLLQGGNLRLYLTSLTWYDTKKGADQTIFYNFDRLGTLHLPATHRSVSLDFALSDLIRLEDQTFSYKIERKGQHGSSEWIYLGNKSQLALVDLPAGRYSILIQGADFRGNRAVEPIVLSIEVGEFFYRQTWFYLLCFLLAAGAVAYWIYRQRMLRKNLERELAARTHEIMDTRDQLIAQEKLASLGQMVAGIAHEIKNPLNFVNNFSEGSEELLAELKEELERYRARPDDATFNTIQAILEDLRLNAIDIVNYGNQADRIVKSMMDHARGTPGHRLNVDLNQLVEDNLNLAYHGFRAINPTFQVHLEKDLDATLEPMAVFPQELGRVLLNILNNACHAVSEKQKSAGREYHPVIRVSTGLENGAVIIRIWDNGPGIPEAIREKIFQPFFTTKPTGEGNTGLGLSISYDIITLQHKGKILVDSQSGEFTEFVIRLPQA